MCSHTANAISDAGVTFFVETPKLTRIRYTGVPWCCGECAAAILMTSSAFLTLMSHITIVSQALVWVPSRLASRGVVYMDSYRLNVGWVALLREDRIFVVLWHVSKEIAIFDRTRFNDKNYKTDIYKYFLFLLQWLQRVATMRIRYIKYINYI